MIDYQGAKFWFDMVQWVLTLGVGLYVWQNQRHQVSLDRIEKLEALLGNLNDRHHDRLARIEEQLKYIPTHHDIGGVYKRVDDVHGDVRQLMGRFDGMQQSLSLIHSHLLEKAS